MSESQIKGNIHYYHLELDDVEAEMKNHSQKLNELRERKGKIYTLLKKLKDDLKTELEKQEATTKK